MTRHGTGIEWTHIPGTKGETWNPIRARNKETGGRGHFCIKVGEECRNCYAERLQPRFRNPIRYAAQDLAKVEIELDEKVLFQPRRWKEPRTIFVCSMTDLFGHWISEERRARIFTVMAMCPQHTFIVLTKRAKEMRAYFSGDIHETLVQLPDGRVHMPRLGGLPNVWLIVSVSKQPDADSRIPELLATPATVRGVSYEPALGPIDFSPRLRNPYHGAVVWNFLAGERQDEWGGIQKTATIDWIIFGGESGPADRRPANMDWGRSALAQCRDTGRAFFGKQNDKVRPLPPDLMVREWPVSAFGVRNAASQGTE